MLLLCRGLRKISYCNPQGRSLYHSCSSQDCEGVWDIFNTPLHNLKALEGGSIEKSN